MTKALSYIRFSSDGQADGSSIERQSEIITLYAQRNTLEITETFIDDGYSASKGHHLSRGQLGRILCDIDAGRYHGFALVVEKMDRFSRLGIEETRQLIRRLIKGGVELHLAGSNRVVRSLDDLPTVIMDAVESYGAKAYADNLRVNVQRGIEKMKDKAAEGCVISRNVPIWLQVVGRENIGNKIINPGKIVVIPEWAGIVREVYRLAALGIGMKNIACKLKDSLHGKSLSWVTHTLQNRAVLGEYTPAGREPIANYYPAIITQAEFDNVRAIISGKRQGGKPKGGNTHSDVAQNLFTGLTWDITTKPMRPMNYHRAGAHWCYLISAFSADGRKQHSMRYDRFESAFLHFLQDLDWQSVVGQTESAELHAAQAMLNKALAELDKVQRRMAATNIAMEADNIDAATLTVLATRLAKDEAQLATLVARRDALQVNVDVVKTRCEALYTPETLLALIQSRTPETNDVRLRLRNEIRRRVEKIGINFSKTGSKTVTIVFVNGARKAVIFKGDSITLAYQHDYVRPEIVPA